MNSVIDRLFWAIKDKKPIPPFEEKLDIADAYEIQKKVSQKIYSSELLGLKAGVTSKDMQNALGIGSPLIGGLFKENRLDKNPTLPLERGGSSNVSSVFSLIFMEILKQFVLP